MSPSFAAIALGLLALAMPARSFAQAYGMTSRAPIGAYLDNRLPTTAPGAATGWSTVVAFPNLTFNDPAFLVAEPGSNRLHVGTLWGVVYHFVNDPNTSTKSVFLDVSNRTQVSDSSGLLGMAFHPDFRKTGSPNRGYVYVSYQYSANPAYGYQPSYNRLSRFTVPDGASAVDPNSELVLIDQYDPEPWHNGGGLFFGEDGFLHLSCGDGGGANDSFGFSQQITTGLFGGVLRIDVNRDPTKSHPIRRQPQSTNSSMPSFTGNYYIPNDNPFLDPNGGVLEEFWAVGLRSPHRMTFDRVGKRIWVGDVGQTTVEEVDIIEKGGNYQWPYREANIQGPKPKPSPLIGVDQPPVYAYPVGDGNNCVIGGYVYRGQEHAALLDGMYVFGDNGSGRIWALNYEGGTPSAATYLCNMPAGSALTGLSSFGEDLNGELYLCQMGPNGRILKLARSASGGANPPALLSQTGVFANLATLAPAAGLIPYDVNSPLWSDAANKQRWIAVPNDGAPYGANETIGFSPTGHWTFPNGTVFVKHFELPIDETNPNAIKRLETRLLVRDATGGIYGLTYKWRADHSDADLLPGSLNEDIVIQTASGGTRTQTWAYPSRQACLSCHSNAANLVLGLNTRQLNGSMTYPGSGVTDNQLRTLNRIAMLIPALNESEIPALDKLAPVTSTTATLEHRVRSYLDANCAHCHRPGGARGFFDARFGTPLPQQGIVDGPVANALGITDAHVISPESIERSIMHRRMNSNDGIRMPPLARNVIDTQAVETLEDWIISLRATQIPPPWTSRDVGFVNFAGGASYSSGTSTFTVNGSGADIAGTADAFQFLHQPWSGDGEIVARVNTVQNTDTWAKAGIMFRETLDAGSRNVLVAATPNGNSLFQQRAATNGSSASVSGFAPVPRWVRLTRAGNLFRGYHSSDGTNWTQISSATLAMPATIYVGLAVSSHNNGTLCAVTFDNVSVSGAGTPPPVAPTNLTATVASSSRIDLTWTDNASNEDGFKIERAPDGTTFTQIATVGANVTTFANSGLIAGTTYTYRVRAARSSGDSAYSNTVSATTSSSPGIAAPTNLVATASSPSRIDLNWTDNANNEDGFKVERSSDGSTFTQIATVAGNITSYANTGLAANTTYAYRVRATAGSGDSSYSNSASATTSGTPPSGDGWSRADIGSVGLAGSDTISGETITVRGSGADIWNTADAFYFVYRTLNGDGTIQARVASLTNTHPWAKAGVMIRAALTANSANTLALVTPSSGVTVQNRASAGASTTSTGGPWGVTTPYWVRLVRTGNTIVGSVSANGTTWTTIASHTVAYGATVQIGLAVTSHNNAALTTAVFDNVSVTGGTTAPSAPAAPTNLVATAVSNTRIDLSWADNATNESTYEIERATDGVTFSQIATLGANVASYSNTALTPGVTYTYRVRATNTAGASAYSNAPSATTPAATLAAPSNLVASAASGRIDLSWTDNAANETGFKIERAPDGVTFTQIATTTTNVAAHADTGLAAGATFTYRVRAFNAGGDSAFSNSATATTPSTPPPAPTWTGVDLGNVALAGSEDTSTSTISVRASGTDIWETADGFRFLYRALSGDGAIVARVVALSNTHGWAKAGVMIRETLTANARNTAVLVTAANGVTAQNRATAGAATTSTSGPWGVTAPYWVRLERTGNTIVASVSPNGASWTTLATHTVSMGAAAYIGLAVTSHTNAALTTATFDNVSATGGGGTTLPAAPTNLVATAASSSRIDLNWTDHATNEQGFKVERASDGVTFTEIALVAPNLTTYPNTGLASSTTYTYRVRATHSSGDSAFSNTASATTPASPLPAAPSGLTATAVSSTQIDLAWTDEATNEETFQIERSFDGVSFSAIATLPANSTTYSNSGLVAAMTYTYRVRAAHATGNSSYSNTVSATTEPASGGLGAPSGLTATAISATQVNLQWVDNSSEQGFKIERSTDGVAFAQIATVGANVTTYANTALTPSTSYAYRVRAAFGSSDSGYSNAVATRTPEAPPAGTWSNTDVGVVGIAGSYDASGNTFTVRGSGNDVWEAADGFHFLYRTLTGDCTIEAQITSLTNTHAWAKAGIMIRETLAANARNVFLCLTPTNGLAVQNRATPGATTTMSPGPWGITAPHWVRLTRTGNTIVAESSPNGATWTTIATHTVSMGATIQVGFAVTAHNNAALNTAVFTDPFIE